MYIMLFYLLIICSLLYIIWKVVFERSKSSEPPWISGWIPIIGHAYKLLGNKVQMLKRIHEIAKETEKKGGIATVFIGVRKAYAVTDPEDSLTIATSCLSKGLVIDMAKPLAGDGLFSAKMPLWKKNRRLLNPAFNQKILDGYIKIFNAQSERLLEQFDKEIGKSFDHEPMLRVINLETICSTSLGVHVADEEYQNIIQEYLSRILNSLNSINDRVQKFWLHNDFIYNMTKHKRDRDEEIKYLKKLGKLIIEKKKSEREHLSNTEVNIGKPRSFVDLLLDLSEKTDSLSTEHIEVEILTVIIGGHDTIATALTYTLAMLGSYVDVQEKAVEEIFQVFGNSNRNVDKDDLNKLVYLDAVFKEILRLYEVTPVLSRYVDKTIKLKKYTLPANSECFILPHALNRNIIWGPDAEEFRPERWLEKETLPDVKYYGAFGLNPRSCIGKTYAMMSMKITLVHVLRRYHIQSDVSNMVSQLCALVRPHSGHHITLTLRNT